MARFPSVDGYRDTIDSLNQEVMNRPINQLRERTDYLLARLAVLTGDNPFESVRLYDIDLLPSDPPALYSFVRLDNSSNTFAPALASAIISGTSPFQFATQEAYAVGMLVDSPGANKGTVAISGKVDLSAVLLTDLVQSNEDFRTGPYYLSTTEPGKMTAEPKGPAIYLGIFAESTSNPGYGDFAVLAPAAKDLWQSHSHFNYALASQPAGDNEITGTGPTDIHRVRGIKPDDFQVGGGNDGAEPPYRLFLIGHWRGQGTPTYTIWITASDDTTATARVFWQTDDGSDDSYTGVDDPDVGGYDPDFGATIGVVIRGYEMEIPIGSNGLSIVLEKGYDSTLAAPDYDAQNFETVIGSTALDERTWTIPVPSRIRGWLPKSVRNPTTYSGSLTDPGYVINLFGRYENSGNVLTEALRAEVSVAGDMDLDNVELNIYDIDNTLIANVTSVGFTGGAVDLGNGLWLEVTRYQSDTTLAASTLALVGDEWTFEFSDEAPGSQYQYNIDMDRSLQSHYPPSPVSAVSLEVDGATMAQRDFFTAGAGDYKPAPSTLHWYDNLYGSAPFPFDWESLADPGLEENAVTAALYMTKLVIASAGIVTSLKPAPGSPVVLLDCNTGEPANVGDLMIAVDFQLSQDDGNAAGFKVVKGVSPAGGLMRGPVVEQVLAGPGIVVTQLNPQFPGQGIVRVSFAGDGVSRGDFTDISLLNAKQELVPNRLFSYIKLLEYSSLSSSNVNTGFIAQFRVPQFLNSRYQVVVYATIFGLGDVSVGANPVDTKWAGLTFTYNILQDFTDEASPAAPLYVARNLATLGSSGVLERVEPIDQDVPFGFLGSGYTAYDPILLHNDESLVAIPGQITDAFTTYFPIAGEDPETVTAGDLVAVKFHRSAPVQPGHAGATYEYTAAIGFINLGWKLVEV